MEALRAEIKKVCKEMYLTYAEGEDYGAQWVDKVITFNFLEKPLLMTNFYSRKLYIY
jgi:hypothetical protein